MPVHRVKPLVPCGVQPVPSHCWHIASAPTASGCCCCVLWVCGSLLPQFRVCLPRLPLMVMPSPSCFCRSYAAPRLFMFGHPPKGFKDMRGLIRFRKSSTLGATPVRSLCVLFSCKNLPQGLEKLNPQGCTVPLHRVRNCGA